MSQEINVGIDTGYGYGLMASSTKKEVKIPSYTLEIEKNTALERASKISMKDIKTGERLIVKINGKKDREGNIPAPRYYALGDICPIINPKVKRYVTDNRANDDKHLAQVLALAGLSVDIATVDINLELGLPTKLKKEHKELVENLTNKFTMSYLYEDGELDREIKFKTVEVIGQAVAPIMSLPENEIGDTILSIDLGHNTNDGCLWIGGGVNGDFTLESDGFRKHYLTMSDKLKMKFPDESVTYSEERLQRAIELGVVKFRGGKTEKVEDLQKEVFIKYAVEVLEDIETTYSSMFDAIDKIILSGGIFDNDIFYEIFETKSKKFKINIARGTKAQNNVVNGLLARVNMRVDLTNEENKEK